MADHRRPEIHARFLVHTFRQETGNERKRNWKRNAKTGNEHGNDSAKWKRAGNENHATMETNATKKVALVSFEPPMKWQETPTHVTAVGLAKLPELSYESSKIDK